MTKNLLLKNSSLQGQKANRIKLVVLILLILFNKNAFTQLLINNWAQNLSSNNAVPRAHEIITDSKDNVYLMGEYNNTTDMDPSINVHNLTPYYGGTNTMDLFIARYDPQGGFQWASGFRRSFGFSSSLGLEVDNNDNFIITGQFEGTLDFDLSSSNLDSVHVPVGDNHIFIAKYDSTSNLIWKQFVYPKNHSSSSILFRMFNEILVDDSNNIYTTGTFTDTLIFNPFGANPTTLIPKSLNDAFIAKYDGNGSLKWVKQFGDTLYTNYASIDLGKDKNLIVTGQFSGKLDFDPSNGKHIEYGGQRGFIACYSPSGSFVWEQTFGDSTMQFNVSSTQPKYARVDVSGDIYIGGQFAWKTNLDPLMNGPTYIPLITSDYFLAKYDSAGNYKWSHQISDATFEKFTAMDLSSTGNVFMAGNALSDVTIPTIIPTYVLKMNNPFNMFFIGFDKSGNFIGADAISAISSQEVYDLHVNPKNEIFIAGQSTTGNDSADFDPSPLSNFLMEGACFAKYELCSVYTNINANINLDSICHGDSINLWGSNGDIYEWENGITDSNWFQPDTSALYILKGGKFGECYGRDTILGIVLPVPHILVWASDTVLCQGDTIKVFDSTDANATRLGNFISGNPIKLLFDSIFYATVIGMNGCKTSDTVYVDVNNNPIVEMDLFDPDTVCINSQAIILPKAIPLGGTYHGSGVSGNQFFPNVAGLGNHSIIYQFQDNNQCKGTDSAFITVDVCPGIKERQERSKLELFPNPAVNTINLSYSATNKDLLIISTINGKTLFSKVLNEMIRQVDISSLSSGSYLLQIYRSNKLLYSEKLIKER